MKRSELREIISEVLKEADNSVDFYNELKKFNINKLDAFEEMQYNHHIKSMPKEKALEVLINTVEGDWTQLSPDLSKIAKKYRK